MKIKIPHKLIVINRKLYFLTRIPIISGEWYTNSYWKLKFARNKPLGRDLPQRQTNLKRIVDTSLTNTPLIRLRIRSKARMPHNYYYLIRVCNYTITSEWWILKATNVHKLHRLILLQLYYLSQPRVPKQDWITRYW